MKTNIIGVLKQIRVLFIPYLFILVGCLGIMLACTKSQIYFTFNSWHFALGDIFFTYYTNMGDGWTAISISLMFFLFSYRKGFLISTSYIITSLTAQVLKFIFAT